MRIFKNDKWANLKAAFFAEIQVLSQLRRKLQAPRARNCGKFYNKLHVQHNFEQFGAGWTTKTRSLTLNKPSARLSRPLTSSFSYFIFDLSSRQNILTNILTIVLRNSAKNKPRYFFQIFCTRISLEFWNLKRPGKSNWEHVLRQTLWATLLARKWNACDGKSLALSNKWYQLMTRPLFVAITYRKSTVYIFQILSWFFEVSKKINSLFEILKDPKKRGFIFSYSEWILTSAVTDKFSQLRAGPLRTFCHFGQLLRWAHSSSFRFSF